MSIHGFHDEEQRLREHLVRHVRQSCVEALEPERSLSPKYEAA